MPLSDARISPFAASTLLLALCASLAPAQSEPKITFETPKKWSRMPALEVDRGACRELWTGDRALPPKRDRVAPHMPNLRVLIFNGTEKPEEQTYQLDPFVDAEDYVSRCYGVPGRITGRESIDVNGIEGTRFTAEIEAAGLAMIGVSFKLPNDKQAAVVYEVLRERASDLKRDITKTFASIQISEDGKAPLRAPWITDEAKWAKADSQTRRGMLEPFAKATVDAIAADPGDGWKAQKSKRWTVFTRASSKDTKRAMQAADAMATWVDENLTNLGDGAAFPAVLRIYGSPQELAATQTSRSDPRGWDPATRTIHFAVDPNAGTGFGYGPLLQGIAWHHIDDHVPGAMYGAPRWLWYGFDEYLRSTRVAKKKINFFPDDVESGRLNYYRNNSAGVKMVDIWNLIQEGIQLEPENGDKEKEGSREWDYTPESARLMRWLFENEGSKAFGKTDFFAEYLKTVGQVLKDTGANPIPDLVAARAGDDDSAREARKQFFKWRQQVRDFTNNRIIPLDNSGWTALNGKWLAFVEE